MGPTFAGTAAAPAAEEVAASIIESSGRVLGTASRGAAAALAVGGAVGLTVENVGAPRPAVRGVMGRMLGRALEALAGEGGVGRERVLIASGSVVFGNRGNDGEGARERPLVSSRLV